MTQTVLVVGATGMLGSRIAHHLLEQSDTDVRLLVRQSGLDDIAKKALPSPLLDRGAQIAQGDLADRASLDRAAMEVGVIVSDVQGGPDAIVDGQLALLQSARKNGVRRTLPSDFAVDLFRAAEGEHPFFDAQRKADTAIQASGLEHVHILNGAFMDNFLNSKFSPIFDLAKGAASFWGEGDEPFDAISVEDAARYTAKAAADRALSSGKFAVASQQLSFKGIIQKVEQVEGRALARTPRLSRGSPGMDRRQARGQPGPDGMDCGPLSALHADRPDSAHRFAERSASRHPSRELRRLCATRSCNAASSMKQAPQPNAEVAGMTGFTHRFAEVSGTRLHYVIGGEGPAVMLLHGWPCTWAEWREVMPRLATTGHTVIAPDMRGFGDSDKPESGYLKSNVAEDVRQLSKPLQVCAQMKS